MTLKKQIEDIRDRRKNYDNNFMRKMIHVYAVEIRINTGENYFGDWDLDYIMECHQIETVYRIELIKRKHC